jgi:hypothetical protein
MSTFIYVVVIVAIICGISLWEQRQKGNPEEWAEKRRKFREYKAKEYTIHYHKVVKRIPKSDWVLMTCTEKSNAFRRRESLEEEFQNLEMDVRKIVVEKHKIDPSNLKSYS